MELMDSVKNNSGRTLLTDLTNHSIGGNYLYCLLSDLLNSL